jgi:PKD repeat protein
VAKATLDGDTQRVTAPLGVPDVPPDVFAGSAQAAHAGDAVPFHAVVDDPGGPADVADVQWDFDYDGSNFDPAVTGTLTPSRQFATPGTYRVALQVTDNHGRTNLSVLDLTVNDVPPTVSAGADLTVTAGDRVSFAGSFSSPNGTAGARYAWDFAYDGQTFNPGAAAGLTPEHVFTTPGTYTVAL